MKVSDEVRDMATGGKPSTTKLTHPIRATASAHSKVPRPGTSRRKDHLQSVIDNLIIAEVDPSTSRPMVFKIASATDRLTEVVGGLSLSPNKSEALASPRLSSAIDDTRSVANVRSLATFKFNDSFTTDEIDARESVWQLRRDHAVAQNQKRLQKRTNSNSSNSIVKQFSSKDGITIFKRGMKISNRRMILCVELITEGLNGCLRFTAYDPVSCEAFEHVENHIDTRGLLVEDTEKRIPKV